MMQKEDFAGPVNLGNPSEISINELANEIIKIVGSSSKIIYTELPQDDPKQRCPDISIAKEKLKWEPKFQRLNGLKKTIKFFDNLLKVT